MSSKKTTNSKGGVAAPIGIAVAALAGIAGAYFLYGSKDAKHNRKQVKGWVVKAKGEVIERLEKLKDVTEEDYHMVVDTVVSKYQALKKGEPDQIVQLVKELKGYWNNIRKDVASKTKGSGKAVTKATKTIKAAAKKAVAEVKKAAK